MRTYDLKGSTYSREVLPKNYDPETINLSKLTLKDKDFENLEKKMYMEYSLSK